MSRLRVTQNGIGPYWLNIENMKYEILNNGLISTIVFQGNLNWSTSKEAQQFLDNWMPPDEWLTKEYVKQEADKGLKEALMCSIIHWRQIVLNVDKAKERDEYYSDHCSMCQYYDKECKDCIISHPMHTYCSDEYFAFQNEPNLENAIVMHNLLVNKYNELFGRKEMQDEMLKIDGVDVSVSTIKNALKQTGIKLEKEYIPKVGEVFQNKYNEYRFILEIDGSYRSFGLDGNQKCNKMKSIAKLCEVCDYGEMRKIGELKDLL